ncbi:MAG: insulinase family protein [Saprospiraceae bacterium]|nr:insulinase family protein [Saprospiraceae bacterium]MCF8250439.1 insulinase family protein [Saprospiraceae bacterium]MCF8282120.1 insulinase family protein [Bacteroidales bacterium]MCF8312415.1 insulinase family protein [Saprospiraceae bacterium]MCF8440588.1 insulinase family protein [Saprospiraceae bacterium]
MIEYERHVLNNGLRVLIHEDKSTPMVAVNVLYDIGSKDENPAKTGFAHLFEHLMFGGSANIPDFDDPIQLAGGENNAFTNNDMTNFYDVLPAENLEVALWLESDRMLSLNFDEKVLETQQKVVVEEFKETCLNEPYGDVWHHISDLAYKEHPYRWPTIGLEPKHVEDAEMQDVKDFFFNFYRPNNAILVVAGNVKPKKALKLVEKWFGDIPEGEVAKRRLPIEPPQNEFREKTVESKVPVDALYLVFHTCSRIHPDFYAVDLLSDVLASGASSRLYRKLLKEKKLFSHIDCYITASNDPGLLIVEGKPTNGVSMEDAEKAVWEELELLISSPISTSELEKIVNKSESSLVFSEVSVLNKAINLAFFELVGDASIINRETSLYQNVTVEEMQRVAKEVLRRENCSKLIYKSTMPAGEAVEEEEDDEEDE